MPVSKMVSCERVDVNFTETAPYRFCNSVDLAITPEQLFEVLADAESWPHWASVITKVTWTSPEPRGVGTTRTVNMRGGIVGDEEFLVWEPFTRMAFRSTNVHPRPSPRSRKTTGSK
jgi:Polyketide cyclase / dehydrase and lipid transport